MTFKPRRSCLYMPGINERAMNKARSLPADVIIFDLEDAVAPDAKSVARESVREQLLQGGYGRRELVVRINALETPWGSDDLAQFSDLELAAICVPKVERPEQVKAIEQSMDELGYRKSCGIWPMAETPAGVLSQRDILAASERIDALLMGTSDLARDLRLSRSAERSGLLHALSHCVLAARERGIDVLDGVHLNIKDAEGFRKQCLQGRELGFDGKTLIHPSQVEPCNELFSPSVDEVERAGRLLDAWNAARAEGKGVAVLDGQLIEILHVEEAQRLLAVAEEIEARQAG